MYVGLVLAGIFVHCVHACVIHSSYECHVSCRGNDYICELIRKLWYEQAVIKEKYGIDACNVGDEGGFAPNISR